MSLADSLYNLQLIQDFCGDNLDRCCHFTLEDMVYASSSIKVSLASSHRDVLLREPQTWSFGFMNLDVAFVEEL